MKKRHCTATTAKNKPCKAWAIRDIDPDLCSAHSKRNVGAGGKKGNTNAQKHGFYRSALTPNEVADLLTYAVNDSVEDELAIVRVMLRRLLEYLQKPIPLADEKVVGEMVGKDVLRFLNEGERLTAAAPLVYRGARTISYMIKNMSGKRQNEVWEDILEELGEGWQVNL